MKIISKYKDYYDFLSGVYGVDEKLILDRRDSIHPGYYTNGRLIFIIGNLAVDVLHIDGKFYCGESDMIALGGVKNINKDNLDLISYKVSYYKYEKRETISIYVTPYGTKRTNDEYNQYAIYLNEKRHSSYNKGEICSYPRLEQYGIQKVLSPHDIWIELNSWLGQRVTENEPSVPIGDDNIKIQSHGFDLKTSFRPKMKNV